MGEASLAEAVGAAHHLEIPPYTFPEDAIRAFGALWQRRQAVAHRTRQAVDAARADSSQAAAGRDAVDAALLAARSAGQTALDADEAAALLQAYGISLPQQVLATNSQDAVGAADRMGYPVALKLISPDILHKTDIGGVLLSLQTSQEVAGGFAVMISAAQAAHPTAHIRGVQVQQMVRGGHEVIVGVKRDPTFGPLVMFGLGGVYVEALADVSFALAPLTRVDAEDMIASVKSARVLDGLRGARPADRAALVDAIVAIGRLAAEHDEIIELDVNPLLVLPEGAVAVDARIILR
jgi:acyl-CoA synthetase (NDP forming)